MALCKEVDVSGVKVSYWKITYISIDAFRKMIQFNISGWPTKEARDNMNEPIKSIPFFATFEEISFNEDECVYSQLYNYIKSKKFYDEADEVYADFTDAQDC